MTGSSNACPPRTCPVPHPLSYHGCGSEKTALSVAEPCDGCVASATSAMPAWNFGLSLTTGACCRGGEFESFVGGPFLMVSTLAYHKQELQSGDLKCNIKTRNTRKQDQVPEIEEVRYVFLVLKVKK